jgi:phosphonate transport system ATP-binding protein
MILEVRQITKRFDAVEALSGVDFALHSGEFVSVIGPSGAGKTTLMRLINGMSIPDSGDILLSGVSLRKTKGRARRRLQASIGTIYQDFALVEPASCLQNVLMACLPDMNWLSGICGLFGKPRRDEAAQLLERVGLHDKVNAPVRTLSGGQKQRVSIARALMRRPALLLADEPVASLDPVTGQQILQLLREIQRTQGLTVLMNSHNVAFSKTFSDRLIGLNAGRVVFDGPPAQLTEDVLRTIYDTPEDAS